MKVFGGIIVGVMFAVACLTQPKANSTPVPNTLSIQTTPRGNTEPVCPPKEFREARFCPDKETPETKQFGCTPLMRAAEGGNTIEVRALLDKGADVNHPVPHWGHTALMLAAGKDQLEVVKILLRLEPTQTRWRLVTVVFLAWHGCLQWTAATNIGWR